MASRNYRGRDARAEGRGVSGFLELPRCPADKFTTVVVVLHTGDEAFNEAVAAWSAEWALRVRCWKLTGEAYGVYVVPWQTVKYEPRCRAHDAEGSGEAIRSA